MHTGLSKVSVLPSKWLVLVDAIKACVGTGSRLSDEERRKVRRVSAVENGMIQEHWDSGMKNPPAGGGGAI